MILRNSAGSVPSTASISVCFKNGSWMACRSASSETTPLRRALLANATSSRISCASCLRGAANRCPRLRNAATTVVSGNCSITAPSVPPNTMSAAVGCRIWPTLPPSISNPATIPAMARNAPPMLALSMCSSLEEDSATRCFYCRRSPACLIGIGAADCPSTSRLAKAAARSRSPK